MASTTHPPSGGSNPDPVSSLYLSDTFYTWFNVSNDLINKVNPIELYSVTADTRDYTGTVQADGILLENLGFGNWKIGYSLPTNITGDHVFHQNINFLAGVSGQIVNTINGQTGDRTAIQTVSGRTADFSGGTGNIAGAIFEINGFSGTTWGAITLDFGGQTGAAGTILTPDGSPGEYKNQVFLFDNVAEVNQVGLRVRGSTHDGRVIVGGTTVDPDYAVRINAINANSLNSATAGGIRIDTDSNDAVDVKMSNQGVFAAGATMYFISGHDSANTGFEFMQGGGGGGTIGDATSVFQIDNEGIVLNEKVKDKDGTSGTTDDILVSGSGGRLSYENGLTAILGFLASSTTASSSNPTSAAVGEIFPFHRPSSGNYSLPSSGKYFVIAFGAANYDSQGGNDTYINRLGVLNGGTTFSTTGSFNYYDFENATTQPTGSWYFGIAIRIE